MGKQPHWLDASADGTAIYVTNEGSNDLTIVDLASGVTRAVPVGNAPRKNTGGVRVLLAEDAADGLHTYEVAVGIKQNKEADVRADLTRIKPSTSKPMPVRSHCDGG